MSTKRHRHTFTNIAPEVSDDPETAEMWKWCSRCGALRLGNTVITMIPKGVPATKRPKHTRKRKVKG